MVISWVADVPLHCTKVPSNLLSAVAVSVEFKFGELLTKDVINPKLSPSKGQLIPC